MRMELTKKERQALDKKLAKVRTPYHVVDLLDEVLTEEERDYMLSSLRGMLAFVGCALPTRIYLDDDTPVMLKDIVWNLISKSELNTNEVVAARRLADLLDRRVEINKKIIEEYDLSEDLAEKLYFQTCGIIRAVMELRGLGKKEMEDEYVRKAREHKVDDAKKLLAFLRRIKI